MNKYEIVKTLGQGGYGKANLVRRKTDKKLFVEKEVRLTSLGPKDREGAIQEAKLLASLRHPYIVEYEESFQERGNLYIVMGYADGGDLAKKIEARGNRLFTEDEILHDFIEVALAIKYIHDRKICHRDLKGQNIFLTKDGTIKLGDFGISKILEHTFQACRTQIGTPFYLSPEICQGRNYNTKTDIWSLGCILYELCTLKHAFNAPNMKQLMMNIIQARYTPIPSQYSQDLRSLVDRMLTKEPDRRPTINQILNTPYIKKQLSNYLEKNLLEYEMGHTRLHDRKPFAPPTIIVRKDPAPPPSKPSQPPQDRGGGNDNRYNDYKEQQRNYEAQKKQLQMKEAALKRKEAEIAARERYLANQNNNKGNNYYQGGGGGSHQSDDEYRARQYYEQKRAMQENKARMQQEMSGNNMRRAIQNQYARGKKNNDYSYSYSYSDEDDNSYKNNKKAYNPKNQGNYEQQARENYFEQLRMVRANRERMKREELQGSEMQRALMEAQVDEEDDRNRRNNRNQDNRQDKRKGGNDNFDAINAYMRQQRHEAAENKRRLEEAERGTAAKAAMEQPKEKTNRMKHQTTKRRTNATKGNDDYYDYYSDYYSDYSDPPQKKPQHPQQQQKQPQQPQQKQKPKNDADALNEYMRQLRHEREANKLRAQEAEKKAKQEEDMKKRALNNQPQASPVQQNNKQPDNGPEYDDEPPPQKEKKVELTQAERNAYMREERHRRRENKARIEAMGRVNMDQLIAEAEAEQRANPRLDDSIKPDYNNKSSAEPEDDNEPPPQKEKKVELTQAERNAYMREERHRRRENKARIEAMGQINMDQLIAEAEAEQRANPRLDYPSSKKNSKESPIEPNNSNNNDNEPPPQKEKKVELTQAERNAYMREERHRRRENKARIEAMGNIDMDQLIAQAEAEQLANPQVSISNEAPQKPQQQQQKQPASESKPKKQEEQQQKQMLKKSPRLLGDEVKDAIKSGRFKSNPSDKKNQQEGSKMTVAEARKQQNHPKSGGDSVSASQQQQQQQGPLLDKNKMKELFQQKREGLRQNHEKIKASQDGSRDPSLLAPSSKSNSTSTSSSTSSSKSSSRSPIGRLLKDNVSGKISTNTNGSTGSAGSVRRKKPEMHSETFKDEVPSSNDTKPKEKTRSQSTSTSTSTTTSNLSTTAGTATRKRKRKSKDKEKDKTLNPSSNVKLDLSQALNSKSTSEFLKSRSIVLENIANEDLDQEQLNNDEEDDEQSLAEMRERAAVINAALDIKDEDLIDKDEDDGSGQNDGSNLNGTSNDMNQGVDYYLKNKGVNLPALNDKDSISYRAEAIRAFLEKEIGIDKVVALKKAALNENGHGDEEGDNIFKGLEPGLVALSRYLFMLDEIFG